MPRGCWRRTSNTPLGRGSICSPGKIDELEKRLADARQAGQLPALARLGRRTAEQKRLARYRRPHLPADSATGVALCLWQGDRLAPAIPQNPPHRVLELNNKPASLPGWALLAVIYIEHAGANRCAIVWLNPRVRE